MIFGSLLDSPGSRRDAVRVTASLEPSVTLEPVGALKALRHPVLLVRGDADELFPLEHARRLAADIPDARPEVVGGRRPT